MHRLMVDSPNRKNSTKMMGFSDDLKMVVEVTRVMRMDWMSTRMAYVRYHDVNSAPWPSPMVRMPSLIFASFSYTMPRSRRDAGNRNEKEKMNANTVLVVV